MISVCSHVSIQVATLRESSITDFALVRLFSSVRSVVLSERWAVGESFATNVAFVRSIAGVGPHMSRHRATLRESTVADGALERFLSAVGPQVSCEISRLSERFLADRALVGLLSWVRSKVCFQRWLPSVRLSTDVAGIVSWESFLSSWKLRKVTRQSLYL